MDYTSEMSSVRINYIHPQGCICIGFMADGDRSVAGFPDPFAVATVGGEQTHTTSVIKKTLNPYWNEMFDLYALLHPRKRNTVFTCISVPNWDLQSSQ